MAAETWFIDWETKRINRMADEREELAQTIERAILTDKFYWDIYTWNYGSTVTDLIGSKSLPFIQGAIEKDVKDALDFEDRIISIEQFEVEEVDRSKGVYNVAFLVITTLGPIRRRLTVNV